MPPQPPQLVSERLTLRPYAQSDQADFVALNTDALARRHMDGPLSVQQAQQRFAMCLAGQGVHAWAVTRTEDAVYLGHVFLQEHVEKNAQNSPCARRDAATSFCPTGDSQ